MLCSEKSVIKQNMGGWDLSYNTQEFQWLQLTFHKYEASLHLQPSFLLRLNLVLLERQQNDNQFSLQ